ncbi:HutD family protein [Rheinheimera sp. 1928-s]|uniref:HutD/Ves family protein n=1 Tax=Rheinheimera sp. 1928-s TaxID=3033803 RepID=UPI002610EB24|nr:HutD family protein [Rheinheimera sp. 1928-s]MDF3123874.1 HutD family protein [Rheinheimera sp. 1928-s]
MAFQLISPNQWQTQAWKNGAGITHQLARSDDNIGMRWRVSIAEVASDGPFSLFEQIDRIIMLLQGNGFCLNRALAQPVVLDKVLVPFAFTGETAIDCTLIDGPVRDFNLMTRRSDVTASVQVLSVTEPLPLRLTQESLLYLASGQLQLSFKEQSYQLEAGQSLLCTDEAGELQMKAGVEPGQLVWIRIL